MSDKIDYLKYRLHQWQEVKKSNTEFHWELPKELLCMMADLIKEIANNLPNELKWLENMLLLIAQLLISLCQSLPNDELKGIQYANTRG